MTAQVKRGNLALTEGVKGGIMSFFMAKRRSMKRLTAFMTASFFFVNIFITDVLALSPQPGSLNAFTRSEYEIACMLRSGQLKFAEKPEDVRFLQERNHARALLLSHGKILADKDLKTRPADLLRAIIHEEVEAVMQILALEDRARYSTLVNVVLNSEARLPGRFLSRDEIKGRARLTVKDAFARLFPEESARFSRQGQGQDEPLANHVAAKGLELVIAKEENLLTAKLSPQEETMAAIMSELVKALRHSYFTGVFMEDAVRRAKIRIATANGMSFAQAANIDAADGPASQSVEKEHVASQMSVPQGNVPKAQGNVPKAETAQVQQGRGKYIENPVRETVRSRHRFKGMHSPGRVFRSCFNRETPAVVRFLGFSNISEIMSYEKEAFYEHTQEGEDISSDGYIRETSRHTVKFFNGNEAVFYLKAYSRRGQRPVSERHFEKFIKEARIADTAASLGVAPKEMAVSVDGTMMLLSLPAKGRSLDKIDTGKLDIHFAEEFGRSLGKLHGLGIWHQDIINDLGLKSEHVFVDFTREGLPQVSFIDFGLSEHYASSTPETLQKMKLEREWSERAVEARLAHVDRTAVQEAFTRGYGRGLQVAETKRLDERRVKKETSTAFIHNITGMFKIFNGPSSSHTAGANRIGYAARKIIEENASALGKISSIDIMLYVSFATTGLGHQTDKALVAGMAGTRMDDPHLHESMKKARMKIVKPAQNRVPRQEGFVDIAGEASVPLSIDSDLSVKESQIFPNTAIITARGSNGKQIKIIGESVGAAEVNVKAMVEEGGMKSCDIPVGEVPQAVKVDKTKAHDFRSFHELMTLARFRKVSIIDILVSKECEILGRTYDQLMEQEEKKRQVMFDSIERGLVSFEKTLAGYAGNAAFKLNRYFAADTGHPYFDWYARACLYALAVAEDNARGRLIVGAPTGGSCGVVAGALYSYVKMKEARKEAVGKDAIHRAMIVAQAIGRVIEVNATLSGAVGGCQAEIGSATAMAAGALMYLEKGSDEDIFKAATMGLMHWLGTTCEPARGYVEIPCIDRNGLAAALAVLSVLKARLGKPALDFDAAVKAMRHLGDTMPQKFKEHMLGGLGTFTDKTAGQIADHLTKANASMQGARVNYVAAPAEMDRLQQIESARNPAWARYIEQNPVFDGFVVRAIMNAHAVDRLAIDSGGTPDYGSWERFKEVLGVSFKYLVRDANLNINEKLVELREYMFRALRFENLGVRAKMSICSGLGAGLISYACGKKELDKVIHAFSISSANMLGCMYCVHFNGRELSDAAMVSSYLVAMGILSGRTYPIHLQKVLGSLQSIEAHPGCREHEAYDPGTDIAEEEGQRPVAPMSFDDNVPAKPGSADIALPVDGPDEYKSISDSRQKERAFLHEKPESSDLAAPEQPRGPGRWDTSGRFADMLQAVLKAASERPGKSIPYAAIAARMREKIESGVLRNWFVRQEGPAADGIRKVLERAKSAPEKTAAKRWNMTVKEFREAVERRCTERLDAPVASLQLGERFLLNFRVLVTAVIKFEEKRAAREEDPDNGMPGVKKYDDERYGKYDNETTITNIVSESAPLLTRQQVVNIIDEIGWERAGRLGVVKENDLSGLPAATEKAISILRQRMPPGGITPKILHETLTGHHLFNIHYSNLHRWLSNGAGSRYKEEINATERSVADRIDSVLAKMPSADLATLARAELGKRLGLKAGTWNTWVYRHRFDFEAARSRHLEEARRREARSSIVDTIVAALSSVGTIGRDRIEELAASKPDNIRRAAEELLVKAKALDIVASRAKTADAKRSARDLPDKVYARVFTLLQISGADPVLLNGIRSFVLDRLEDRSFADLKQARPSAAAPMDGPRGAYEKLVDAAGKAKDLDDFIIITGRIVSMLRDENNPHPGKLAEKADEVTAMIEEAEESRVREIAEMDEAKADALMEELETMRNELAEIVADAAADAPEGLTKPESADMAGGRTVGSAYWARAMTENRGSGVLFPAGQRDDTRTASKADVPQKPTPTAERILHAIWATARALEPLDYLSIAKRADTSRDQTRIYIQRFSILNEALDKAVSEYGRMVRRAANMLFFKGEDISAEAIAKVIGSESVPHLNVSRALPLVKWVMKKYPDVRHHVENMAGKPEPSDLAEESGEGSRGSEPASIQSGIYADGYSKHPEAAAPRFESRIQQAIYETVLGMVVRESKEERSMHEAVKDLERRRADIEKRLSGKPESPDLSDIKRPATLRNGPADIQAQPEESGSGESLQTHIEITLPAGVKADEASRGVTSGTDADVTWTELFAMADVYRAGGQAIILYADDLVEENFVEDLEGEVARSFGRLGRLAGCKAVIYSGRPENGARLYTLIKSANPEVETIMVLKEELRSGGDEVKEAEALVRAARAKGAKEAIGLIRGPSKKPEELAAFARASKLPVVVIGPEKGAYSLRQAIAAAIAARIRNGEVSGWLMMLPPIRTFTEDIRLRYEEFKARVTAMQAA